MHTASTSTRWHFAFALCCHSNKTRAPIANPPNSAQLGSTPTIPPSYIRVHAVVWARGYGQTHRRAWPTYISRPIQLTRNVMIKEMLLAATLVGWILLSAFIKRTFADATREMQSVYVKVVAKDILLLSSNLELKMRGEGTFASSSCPEAAINDPLPVLPPLGTAGLWSKRRQNVTSNAAPACVA